jgi:hypothetical protein
MTLIELLIVVAISAIIMIALLELYMTGQKYFFNQNSRADTIEESRMPMAWISRDIRGATGIHNEANSLPISGTTYSTGPNCLILEVPTIDGAGNITGTDYIVYAFDSANHRLLRIIKNNGGSLQDRMRVLADNLVSDGGGGLPFKLEYFTETGAKIDSGLNNSYIVEVELTAQGRSIQRGSQPFVETVRTQAKLRNKVIPVIPS